MSQTKAGTRPTRPTSLAALAGRGWRKSEREGQGPDPRLIRRLDTYVRGTTPEPDPAAALAALAEAEAAVDLAAFDTALANLATRSSNAPAAMAPVPSVPAAP